MHLFNAAMYWLMIVSGLALAGFGSYDYLASSPADPVTRTNLSSVRRNALRKIVAPGPPIRKQAYLTSFTESR